MRHRPPFLPAAVVLLLTSAAPAHAAGERGVVFGRATTTRGRPLPRITVSLTTGAATAPLVTVTSSDGRYEIFRVPAGRCSVSFAAPGGVTVERSGIGVAPSAAVRVDVLFDEQPKGQAESAAVVVVALDPRTPTASFDAAFDWMDHAPLSLDPLSRFRALPWVATTGAGDAGGGMVLVDGIPAARDAGDEPFVPHRGALVTAAVHRGTADASAPVTGPILEIVTKSAAARFGGEAHGERSGYLSEFALEAGGPLGGARTRAWGALGRTISDPPIPGLAGASDHAETTAIDLKLSRQWTARSRSEVTWSLPRRSRPARGLSFYDRVESTTRQRSLGLARPVRLRQQWARAGVSLEGALRFSDTSFVLDFHDPRLADVQAAYDRFTLVSWRSGTMSRVTRRSRDAEFDAAWLLSLAGTGHSVRAGFQHATVEEAQRDRAGGGAVAVFDSRSGAAVPYQARVTRDGLSRHAQDRLSVHVSDVITRGHVTLTLGARFDRRDDDAPSADVPANVILPDELPALRFGGVDSGVRFDDWSPRLGVAWNVGGRGTTIVRLAGGRAHAEDNDTSAALQPTQSTRLAYWWNDANGDSFVQREELDLEHGPAATPPPGYDPKNPAEPRTQARVDAALKSRVEEELSSGVEHALPGGVTLRAEYAARRFSRLSGAFPVEADGSSVSSESYYPVTWIPTQCPDGAACAAVTYYARDARLPAATVRRNTGEYAWQHSLTLAAHKRSAHGWMLDTSVEWRRSRRFFPSSTRDYTDPTNVAVRDGTEYSMPTPHWVVRVAGTARIGRRFQFSTLIDARQGLPFDRVVSSPNRRALGSTSVSIARYGTVRYPAVCRVDSRVDWTWSLGRMRLVPAVEAVNLLDRRTVLARNRVQNSRTANAVTQLEPGRALRIGVGVSW
jgi:hypothetical protein